jgi:hypothetical protein
MEKPRGATALLSLMLLGACWPWPQSEQVSPVVAGTILYNGEPSSWRLVTLTYSPPRPGACGKPVVSVITNDSGRFFLPATDKTHFPTTLMDHATGPSWAICLDADTAAVYSAPATGNTAPVRLLCLAPKRSPTNPVFAYTCRRADSTVAGSG